MGLNLISEEDKRKTIVKAVSGAPGILSRLMDALGSNLEGTEWEAKYEAIKINKKNKLIYFSSFKEIGYYDFLPRLAPVLKTIEKLLLPGGLYTIEFDYQEEFAHYSVMQNVAQRIAKKMGLSQSEFYRLEMLIPLQDIGEINISEEILNKKGPLTAEEWEIIKKHPETGYRIVLATEEFTHVAEDILSHHERWDGS